MTHRWAERTADVELEIEAPTEEAVFTEALHALAELLGDGARGERISCAVAVTGGERAVLLVQWLDELVYRPETEDLVPEDVERIELSEGGLIAAVPCHRGNPRHVVKGTTLHRLAFEPPTAAFARQWCSMSDRSPVGVSLGFARSTRSYGAPRLRPCGHARPGARVC